MKHAVDPHTPFRQLVADRLDGVLAREDSLRLHTHLATCPRCRMAERAYLRDRQLLRRLGPLPPPRDLWVRTAAALDREIARHARHGTRARHDRRARRSESPVLMLSALASLVLGVAVVGTQLRPSGRVEGPDGPAAGLPTPFDVPTQALAFVELTDEGLAIYQTTVDRACPPVAIDCAEASTTRRRVVAAPGQLTAVDLDLHEANGHLALLTSDDLGNDTVSVVILPRVKDPIPALVRPLPSDGPVAPTLPLSVAASPAGPPAVQPSTAPASSDEGPDAGAAATADASPVRASAKGPESPHSPGGSPWSPVPATTPAADASVPAGSAAAGADGSTRRPGAPSAAGGSSESGASLAVPSTSPVPAELLAVLEDVHVVGARPAWSPDGAMLAFSAMPADASAGPDVYTWRVGDPSAKPLTNDGLSYFASWSRDRVVVSRAQSLSDHAGIRASTFVIDPVTRLERLATGDGGWLPAVDPRGRSAITWHGELAAVGGAVVPVRGALSMVDWGAIDPFSTTIPTDPVPAPGQGDGSLIREAPETGAGAAAEAGAKAEAGEQTSRTERGRGDSRERGARGRRGERREGGRPREASPASLASPLNSGPPASPSLSPSEEPWPSQVPLEPERDLRSDPVREWQIHWSADSSAFGFWVTETPGAAWGQLAVLRVDRSSSSIDRESNLLAPTLARRSFTLGRDRVAWVAPSEDRADGELRLRTWGSLGFGSLRIREFDVSSGLPAF